MSKHSDQAVSLFREGYNCSQSVLGAFCDETGLSFELSMKLASSFGGGMGRLREVCGAVSGMFLVIGAKYGYTSPKDAADKAAHYQLVQSLAKEFESENGSIICRELLGLPAQQADDPTPAARTEDYYRKRPCAQMVACAAEILDRYLEMQEGRQSTPLR